MMRRLASLLIARAEKRTGVALDYTRKIAQTDLRLLLRYNKIFGFLDPNRRTPPEAFHTARLRGAIAADCGTCVAAEINLAKAAGLSAELLEQIASGDYDQTPPEIAAVARLTDAVVGMRQDDPESREEIRGAYGEAGLIELSFAMNGAALLPGVKRAMGYAVICDLGELKRLARAS